MSRKDEDREYLLQLIISICDYARIGYEISTCDNCNNCGRRKSCEYVPKLGSLVRYKCPLWVR